MVYQKELPQWFRYDNVPAEGLPEGAVLWSGNNPPPKLGEKFKPTLNGWDGKYEGTVVGYSTLGGWLGIILDMWDRPEWHRKEFPTQSAGYFAGRDGF